MIERSGSAKSLADSWFVVWTESRAEKKVQTRVSELGFTAWLPTVTERRRWSDRWRDVVLPLFPGYLFVQAGKVEWSFLLRTPGVLSVVKRAGRPALLDDEFITTLRTAVECGRGNRVTEVAHFEPSDPVMIVCEGPLKGVRGVVREKKNGRQLIVWIEEIGRGIAITIGSALVEATA